MRQSSIRGHVMMYSNSNWRHRSASLTQSQLGWRKHATRISPPANSSKPIQAIKIESIYDLLYISIHTQQPRLIAGQRDFPNQFHVRAAWWGRRPAGAMWRCIPLATDGTAEQFSNICLLRVEVANNILDLVASLYLMRTFITIWYSLN